MVATNVVADSSVWGSYKMKPHSLPTIIAVVDDDESVRFATASLLRSCGWTVRSYASGSALLSEIGATDICLVVADVQMPEMDGFALTQKLAERSDVPVIFVTAYETRDIVKNVSTTGAAGFFTKPLDDVLFLARVAEIVGATPRATGLASPVR
ncbi:FixJ family two-component response regulator [Paraburkholderia sp. GAS41]|uniref:response regulator transcription factor n=1 Tax=Paraburkholderia sp. GAS41 TaxID=3035134 RepID=UPI003D20F639